MKIKCPNCGHIGQLDDFFEWFADSEGYPTVDVLTCPQCLCSNMPYRGDLPMRDERGRFVEYPKFAHYDDFVEIV